MTADPRDAGWVRDSIAVTSEDCEHPNHGSDDHDCRPFRAAWSHSHDGGAACMRVRRGWLYRWRQVSQSGADLGPCPDYRDERKP